MSAGDKTDYKRLYKVQSGSFGIGVERSAIFAAEDHFLLSTGKTYNEEYYRFFYSDLLALKVRIPRWSHAILLTLLAIISLVFFTVALLMDDVGIRWIFMTICIIFSAITAYVAMCGPHVKLAFKTVTTEKDFPMGRKKKVMKMLAKLRPYIEKAQGSYDYRLLLEETNAEEKEYKV